MAKKKIKFFIKLTITFFLVYLVFKNIDTQKLYDTIKRSDLLWLFIGFILYNISKVISAYRLNYYFKEYGVELNDKTNLQLYYLGMFYNLFLPGGIGGDGYKAYILNKMYSVGISKLVKALLFDRISGLIGLLFFLLLLMPYLSTQIKYQAVVSLTFAFTLYPVYIYICKRYKIFYKYIKHTLILGVLVQFVQILSALAIIHSFGIAINYTDFTAVFLLSSIVGALPITVGGIGARELTFLYSFDYLGYPVDIGIAFSLLFFIITALSSMIGAIYINKKFI